MKRQNDQFLTQVETQATMAAHERDVSEEDNSGKTKVINTGPKTGNVEFKGVIRLKSSVGRCPGLFGASTHLNETDKP